MDEHSALIVADMQIDFCPGEALGVKGGNLIIPLLNLYIHQFVKEFGNRIKS